MTPAAQTKPLDIHEQRAVIARLVRAPGYAAIIADGRKKEAQRRAAMLRELAAGAAEEDRLISATARAYEEAETVARAAEQSARDARQAANEAQGAMFGAHSRVDKRRGKIRKDLRATADPRIAELRGHLDSMEEAVRHCCRPVLERTLTNWLTGRQSVAQEWNTGRVHEVRATLRELQGELDALQVGDYGDDCRPMLLSVLARAEAACEPLGAFAESPFGRRLARHEIPL